MFEWLTRVAQMGCTAYISHPSFLLHNSAEDHPENPDRLLEIKNKLIEDGLFDDLQEIEAPLVTDIQLSRVHPPKYIQYLESVAPYEGVYKINDETIMDQNTFTAMKHAAGAVVKGVDMVMQQKTPNAFCAIRPPGHHAETDKAMGFCFLNNIAIGAMHAIAEYHLERILIIDFDVHHANGTEEIFKDSSKVMLISMYEEGLFAAGVKGKLGTNENIIKEPLEPGSGSKEFRELVTNSWIPLISEFKPELILLSAGFDAHKDDWMSHINLVEEDYKWVTQHIIRQAQLFCEGKVVSVLEGGYHIPSLTQSVSAHIKAMVDVLDKF